MPAAPVVSADGRFVAFISASPDLAPNGDSNESEDVFVRDMQTGVTRLVSGTPSGATGNAKSHEPSISADGRYIAFTSGASDLVPSDASKLSDVFVRDMVVGSTTLISATPAGPAGNGQSIGPSISADGRVVAFTSTAQNLVAGDTNAASDVFVRDMVTQTSRLVSATPLGVPSNGWSSSASLSANGQFVAFSSSSDDLLVGDSPATYSDVFIRDLVQGVTRLVSATPGGGFADDSSHSPSLSADGRYVAFGSFASNLDATEPAEVRGTNDVFVRDMVSNVTRTVSVPPPGKPANDWSFGPSISDDGQLVSFIASGYDMISGESKEAEDVYVRDMTTGSVRLVSATPSGDAVNEWHLQQSMSGDGLYLVFSTFGNDLLPAGTPYGLGIFRARIGS
jgi:Tol biopolymer transport system component